MVQHTERFEAPKEIPYMHKLAQEHLNQCRACCERTSRHHLNVEPVLTDVQVLQQAEISTNVLKHVQKLLEEWKVWSKKENWVIYVTGTVVGMIILTLSNGLVKFLFGG